MAYAIICNSLDVAKYFLLVGWDIESSVYEVLYTSYMAPLGSDLFNIF